MCVTDLWRILTGLRRNTWGVLPALSSVSISPPAFCAALRLWLADAPGGELAHSLAVVRSLLATEWLPASDASAFERQLRQLATNEQAMASPFEAQGARVALHLWEALQAGALIQV